MNEVYNPYKKDKIYYEGFLLKQGRNRVNLGNNSDYQRRYCVLFNEPEDFRIYETMVPSFYGNVFINEKQSVEMSCFRDIRRETADTFTLKFEVKSSVDKALKAAEGDEQKEERIYRFKCEDQIAMNEWVKQFESFKTKTNKGTVVKDLDNYQVIGKIKNVAVVNTQEKKVEYLESNYIVADSNACIDRIYNIILLIHLL